MFSDDWKICNGLFTVLGNGRLNKQFLSVFSLKKTDGGLVNMGCFFPVAE
jgi:hypothetical protein